jgi:hypothetical protein
MNEFRRFLQTLTAHFLSSFSVLEYSFPPPEGRITFEDDSTFSLPVALCPAVHGLKPRIFIGGFGVKKSALTRRAQLCKK